MDVRTAALTDIDAETLYALLRLRVQVFVVEQRCAYPELDGRDLEPDAVHVWVGSAPDPDGYLRVLHDDDGARRIGRVCVRSGGRGTGIAAELMGAGIAVCDRAPIVLDAQAHLTGWYARFGFAPQGEEFIEDGIPHVRMRRPGQR